jgi:hypothetical protein
MWSYVSVALIALAASGCDRTLDLTLAADPSCASATIPAGGSLRFDLVGEAAGATQTQTVCGGCIPVTSAVAPGDLLAFLRANGPDVNQCTGAPRNGAVLLQVTAWSQPQCPASETPVVCADSNAVTLPDGTGDAQATATLTCQPCGSSTMSCMPTTCAAEGKDCGFIADGCGNILNCGDCKHPMKCGGGAGGMPNVCGK